MSETKKLEEALELLLNEQDEEADKLFHQYFVSQARKINEEFEENDDSMPYDMEDDLTSEIESDSEEVSAEEGTDGSDEDTGEEEMETDSESEEEGEVEDRVDDLEDALDELRAEFDKLMGMEEEEHDEDIDGDGQVGSMDSDSEEEDMEDEETLELEDDEVEESVELRQQGQHITDRKYKDENKEAGAGQGVSKNTSSGFGKKGPAKADAGPGQLHSQGGGHTGFERENAPGDVYGGSGEVKEYNDADNVYDTSKNVNKKQGETVTDKGHKQEKELGSGGKSVNTNKQSVLRKSKNG